MKPTRIFTVRPCKAGTDRLILGLVLVLALSVVLVLGTNLGLTGDQVLEEEGGAVAHSVRAPAIAAEVEPGEQLVAPPDRQTLAVRQEAAPRPPLLAADSNEAPDVAVRRDVPDPRNAATMGEQRERMRGLLHGDPAARLRQAHEILAEETRGASARRALEVLIELDPQVAVLELRELIAQPDVDPRRLGVTPSMIVKLGGKDGALTNGDLASLFASGANDVRAAAASALEARGDASLVREFLAERSEVLAGRDDRSRVQALRELSALRSPATKQLIVSLLTDDSEEVRLQAVQSLGRHRCDPEVIDKLRPLLEDRSERVRRVTSRVVEMTGRRRVTAPFPSVPRILQTSTYHEEQLLAPSTQWRRDARGLRRQPPRTIRGRSADGDHHPHPDVDPRTAGDTQPPEHRLSGRWSGRDGEDPANLGHQRADRQRTGRHERLSSGSRLHRSAPDRDQRPR